jgi:site-specific DNA recombinase
VAAAAARRLVPAPEREPAADALTLWAERSGRRRGAEPARGVLRFAFYGRVSTEDYQDPVTSRARQLARAAALVAGSGQITAEFFDAGQSRCCRGPAARRPPRCWRRWPTRTAGSTRS